MAENFTDKELDALETKAKMANDDLSDAYAEHINWQADRIEELEKALCDIYDLWIEDTDPQECQDAHDLVHKLLRDER